MLDTVLIKQGATLPRPKELIALGFVSADRRNDEQSVKWFNNPEKGSGFPRLTWSRHELRGDWLSAEVSLPKFFLGNNVEELKPEQIAPALGDLGDYVEVKSHRKFDIPSARVARIDFCRNWKLENQMMVSAYIRAFQRTTLPKYSKRVENDSTVSLQNGTRKIVLYSKFDELQQTDAPAALLKDAEGVLRFETRFINSRACRMLGKRFDVKARVSELLRPDVWQNVMQADLRQTTLDQPIKTLVEIDRRLIEVFDFPKGCKYQGFLAYRERYGKDFWKEFRVSEHTIRKFERDLRDHGFLLVSDYEKDGEKVELPGLTTQSCSLMTNSRNN